MIPKHLKDSRLFVECIEALGPKVEILNQEESDKVINLFEKRAPFYEMGSRMDWGKVEKKVSIDSPGQIISALKKLLPNEPDYSVYVFWNDASLPVIKTDLETIIKSYDDVVCNGFETFMYNPEKGYVVEHYYLGEIHVGLI